MRMNPEIKAKWVTALRSGEYQQGRVHLRDGDNNFCCLGVLCDIAVKEREPIFVQLVSDDIGRRYKYNDIGGSLPDEVSLWAGLVSDEDTLVHDPVVGGEPLSIQNDAYRLTFDEIADLIEEEL